MAPYSEASEAGLLASALTGFGVYLGREAHYEVRQAFGPEDFEELDPAVVQQVADLEARAAAQHG